ncbi:hypothetical protein LER58_32300, partial [Pseudomonas aeruginosa]
LPVRMSVEQVSGSAWAECPNGVESARMESVEEFLSGGTLLAKLFLHIEADPGYWLGESERLIEAVC